MFANAVYGLTFADELKAAGLLGKLHTWNLLTGEIADRGDLTAAEEAALAAVIAAHDPHKRPPMPVPESERLLDALIAENILPGAAGKRDAILARVRGA